MKTVPASTSGVASMPAAVLKAHCSLPVAASSAWTLPPSSPKKTRPPAIAAAPFTGLSPLNCQSSSAFAGAAICARPRSSGPPRCIGQSAAWEKSGRRIARRVAANSGWSTRPACCSRRPAESTGWAASQGRLGFRGEGAHSSSRRVAANGTRVACSTRSRAARALTAPAPPHRAARNPPRPPGADCSRRSTAARLRRRVAGARRLSPRAARGPSAGRPRRAAFRVRR